MRSHACESFRRRARVALCKVRTGFVVIAVLAAACVEPNVALANIEAWEGINRDVGKLQLYVDRSNIVRKADLDMAWLLFDFRDPHTIPSEFRTYQSVKALVSVNCSDGSYARLREIKFSGPHG